MKTACIIQARLGSTRLPAKVLLRLPEGNCVLEEVMFRCLEIPGVDVVVAAIPDTPENDIVAQVVGQMEDIFFLEEGDPAPVIVRGPEHDVLARYAKAAEAVKADVILRVTSDCPLIDPRMCGAVLEPVLNGCAISYNNGEGSHALAWSCEAFTIECLRRAAAEATDPYDREHVFPFIRRNPNGRAVSLQIAQDGADQRPPLDTLEDYVRIWRIFQEQMREAA